MSSGEYSFLAHTKAYTGLDVRSVAISCNEIYRREKATVMLTIPDLPGYQGLTHKKWLSQKMMCQFHLLVLDHMFGSGFHLPKPSSAKSLRKKGILEPFFSSAVRVTAEVGGLSTAHHYRHRQEFKYLKFRVLDDLSDYHTQRYVGPFPTL
jgi:hypothetical protein